MICLLLIPEDTNIPVGAMCIWQGKEKSIPLFIPEDVVHAVSAHRVVMASVKCIHLNMSRHNLNGQNACDAGYKQVQGGNTTLVELMLC